MVVFWHAIVQNEFVNHIASAGGASKKNSSLFQQILQHNVNPTGSRMVLFFGALLEKRLIAASRAPQARAKKIWALLSKIFNIASIAQAHEWLFLARYRAKRVH